MTHALFKNDNNVSIQLINHPFSSTFLLRDNHEVLFRRINTFLINKNIINKNIIDLGSWIGDNTIPWCKNINSIVYAIDPSYDNCDFIKKMCELNEIKNITVIQSAISNVNEILSTNEDLHHCSFVYNNPGLTGINKTNAVTLDYLYIEKIIENIGYIHLDVEGMEYKVLEGSYKLINDCRPLISFEQHLELDDYDIIINYLKKLKYTIFLIDEVLPGCRPDCRNFFAFTNEIYNDSLIEEINNHIGKKILIHK
jgi:FkbM family methyltransferase